MGDLVDYSYDFGRYLPHDSSERLSFFFAWAGMFIVATFTFTLSAAITSAAGSGFDVGRTVEAALPGNFGLFVLFIMLFGLLPANLANLLVGPALLSTLDLKLIRTLAVLITAACGLPIAVTGIFQPSFGSLFEGWMLTLLIWLGPWLTIVLIDFFLLHRGVYTPRDLFSRDSASGSYFWPGIVSWLVGVLAAVAFGHSPGTYVQSSGVHADLGHASE